MAYFITNSCTKCGACLFECPTNSILEGAERYIIDTDTCDHHKACVSVCPVNAIVLYNPSINQDSAQVKPNVPPKKK